MSFNCPNPIDGFGFSPERIEEAVARRGLLSMEIEFSRVCNFRCPYCYNPNASAEAGEPMTSPEIDSALLQARDLGAEKIIVLGGEPMIYPLIRNKIEFIRRHGMAVEMFTNGSCMTEGNARFMFEHEVAVVLKINSFKADLQNRMTGRKDAYDIIWSAFENLKKAGYPAPGRRLAVSTVITRGNLAEMPGLWRWLRGQGVEPYFEMITPQGGATVAADIEVSPEEHCRLFDELAAIDRSEFGHSWRPQPPLVGNSCLRHRFSCLLNAYGEVMPCVGVTIPLGSIRQQPLREILDKSEVLENLRDYTAKIKEPCASCDQAAGCYGCRGAAYQLTGDYLAADPMCWRNQGKSVESLPVGARPFLPHREPILLVDQILSVGERCAELCVRVPESGSLLVGEDGVLEAAACVEIVAQSFASVHGFQAARGLARNPAVRGYLLGAKGFAMRREIRAGDRLLVRLRKVGRYGDFGVVEGTILRDGEELTRGEVNVYQEAAS